jgi:hypothetical protein
VDSQALHMLTHDKCVLQQAQREPHRAALGKLQAHALNGCSWETSSKQRVDIPSLVSALLLPLLLIAYICSCCRCSSIPRSSCNIRVHSGRSRAAIVEFVGVCLAPVQFKFHEPEQNRTG